MAQSDFKADEPAGKPAVSSVARALVEAPPLARLNAQEITALAGEISNLASAGIPLDQGLEAASREIGRGRLASTLHAVAMQLRAGRALPEVLQEASRRLPNNLQALLLAGLRTSRLDTLLHFYIENERRIRRLRARLTLSLGYPAFLLAAVAVLALGLAFTLGRQTDELFAAAPLQFVASVAQQSTRWEFLAQSALTMLAAGVLVFTLSASASRGAIVRRLVSGIPLLGALSVDIAAIELFRMVALLLEARLPLDEALLMGAAAVSDPSMARGAKSVAEQVAAGSRLADAYARTPRLPQAAQPLLQWGEAHGALAESFQTAAEIYEGKLMDRVSLLNLLLPVLVFLAVAALLAICMSVANGVLNQLRGIM